MSKVIMIGEFVYDWYTGVRRQDSLSYEGEVCVVGMGWFDTWFESGERVWRYIGKPRSEWVVEYRELSLFRSGYTVRVSPLCINKGP